MIMSGMGLQRCLQRWTRRLDGVIGTCYAQHRAQEFRSFLEVIDAHVPPELEIHLILDNYVTHKTRAVQDWLMAHPRYHLHFTPTSASWLNLVECWFAILTKRRLRPGSLQSKDKMEEAILAFVASTNRQPKPFVWTKSADEILGGVARFY